MSAYHAARQARMDAGLCVQCGERPPSSWTLCAPCLALKADVRRCRVYGLARGQWEERVVGQAGRCAICGQPFTDTPNGIHVDHDHRTGSVRGLCCGECNRLLGACRDDPRILAAAIDYLALYSPPLSFLSFP